MKKLLCLVVLAGVLLSGCGQEVQNKIARKKVEFMEGNYTAVYTDNNYLEKFEVTGGKITTRGNYYFFWQDCMGKKSECYVQTPIARTIIKERK